jgi:hypothetical protein
MTTEKLTLAGFLTFVTTIAVFLALGPVAGLRFVGARRFSASSLRVRHEIG